MFTTHCYKKFRDQNIEKYIEPTQLGKQAEFLSLYQLCNPYAPYPGGVEGQPDMSSFH